MSSLGIELNISTGERPQTYALDREPTGIGTGDLDGLGEGKNHQTLTSNLVSMETRMAIRKEIKSRVNM